MRAGSGGLASAGKLAGPWEAQRTAAMGGRANFSESGGVTSMSSCCSSCE